MAFKFEELRGWDRALDLTGDVHELSRKFPKEELYVLAAQIKRASDSVALNIAEGSTGQSNAEFGKFVGYAICSAIEVVACLFIGRRRQLIADEDFERLYSDYEALTIKLQALRKSLS